ncbi:N-acyl-D-amino-acid deacylase family protein [Sphingomonas sp. DT-204]|uniref:N-acyl-D-amino-acid deacylase family protein n=1 Tax=Sphingomonas sp. DT-204 TaxID=3396166 RepID=UPI003F1C7CB2
MSGISHRLAMAVAMAALAGCAPKPMFDVVVRGGTIYDGGGGSPYVGDVAIVGDRIAYVGPRAPGRGKREIGAAGKAVAPGFINVLSQSAFTLVDQPLAESDLRQGVTLEIVSEGESPGPLTPAMRRALPEPRPPFAWTTLGDYMTALERRGIAVNVASYVGAATVRMHVLGNGDVQPSPRQLDAMRTLVRQAMEEGAVGVSSALIYVPGVHARTDELVALAAEAARCGGVYASHIRSEGDRFLEAVAELIEIARRSGAPAELFHIKVGGRANWPKMAEALAMIEAARADGVRVTADMYPYPASGTGLDAAMPPWVQEGGTASWIARLRRPAIRRRVIAEMQAPPRGWENVLRSAGAGGAIFAGFRNPALRGFTGRTLAEVARERGVSPEEAAVDLVVADGSRIEMIYFTMTEANLRRQIAKPYIGFASDGPALTAAGATLRSSVHPRAYGSFARVFARYVRDDKLLSVAEAVRRVTSLPAATFHLADLGVLRAGAIADVTVFDPAEIQDHATYFRPHAYATGVSDVLVNGRQVLAGGEPTGERPGRFVRGRGARVNGGCRASAAAWD